MRLFTSEIELGNVEREQNSTNNISEHREDGETPDSITGTKAEEEEEEKDKVERINLQGEAGMDPQDRCTVEGKGRKIYQENIKKFAEDNKVVIIYEFEGHKNIKGSVLGQRRSR